MNDRRRKTIADVVIDKQIYDTSYTIGFTEAKETVVSDMRYLNSISSSPIEFESRIKKYFLLKSR